MSILAEPLTKLSLALLLCGPFATPLSAKNVYKWTDEYGIVHYSDKAPPEQVRAERIRIPVEPKPIARLALESGQARYRARARNLLAGHVQVEIDYQRNDNIDSRPRLPTRQVLPPLGELTVAELFPLDHARQGQFTLSLSAVPGRPDAEPEDVVYLLPVDTLNWRLGQGFGGAYSHSEPENLHAIDLVVTEGTPVLAAREGVVMQAESDFDRAGLDREKFAGRANQIRIEHDDGSMAIYAHLREGGVLVRPGQRVRAGQRIGESGNTGFSTGPHLHFVVQINAGMRLVSIPFRMHGPDGQIPLSP